MSDLIIEHWFDEWLDPPAAQAFDPAFMAAMSRSWPDIVFSRPQAVASGMTPPDNLPT
jgi:hypothetical protein